MSNEDEKEPQFNWGKKKGIGGKNKNVHIYESFSYDGEEYSLYDCAYMYKHDEPAPYIGKLVKICQTPDMSRKIKVHWFFRPSEISYHLRDVEVLENELFFASGAGIGLANLNPLEAIAGKCNIVCISLDQRNPQPSPEELQKADFIFYRTFNVDNFKISDKMGDSIGGHEVKYVFNRKKIEIDRSLDVPPLDWIIDTTVVGLDKGTNGCSKNPLVTNTLSEKPPVKRSSNTSVDMAKEKPIIGYDGGNKDVRLTKDTCPMEGSDNGTMKKMKEKIGSMEKSLNTSTIANLSKEKTKIGHDGGNKDVGLAKDSCPMERPSKKAKNSDNGTRNEMKEMNHSSQTKNSHLLGHSYDDKVKSRPDKSPLSDYQKDKMAKLYTIQDGPKVFEVTRRPIVEKTTWMKWTWEQKLKNAQGQERLVLLQNLDPEYTSGEVEDIIWHAFNEICEAKMVQHTATSNPNSGQAFVIFKLRDSIEKVAQKLDERCLMLPNKRPLVIYTEVPKFEGCTSFVGHLAIDKARRQIQREMKDAVSTSHYSQNNTIEYEMAMAWCLLQSKSDKWREKLFKQQTAELKKLQDNLKLK